MNDWEWWARRCFWENKPIGGRQETSKLFSLTCIPNFLFRFLLVASCTLHLVLSARLFGDTAAQPPQPPIHFESDSLEYQETDQIIIASGNVKVQQSSYTFHSNYANFNVRQKNLSAWGSVQFFDLQGNEIRAKLLTYSAGKGSAELSETEGSFGPWLFAAKKVTRDEDGNFFLERARLSTCETDLSKYHLYGHRIKILPQKRLTVQHALFRVGPVPILYLPYYYYSLGEKHLAFQFFPGKNQSEGPFARTVWGYPTSDETYTRLYLDYLSRRGVATGGELNYNFGEKAKGSLYGLRISDKLTNEERWNVRLFHWQQLAPQWTIQINANRLSDDSFPNDFFREDFNRVVRDPQSSIATTYQRKNYYFRVFAERSDLFDLSQREFFAREILAPKAEFNQLQSPLGFWGLEKIISVSFANRFAGNSSSGQTIARQYRRESEAQASILRRFRLAQKTSFVPKLTLKNQWIDRPQNDELSENFIQKLAVESAFRQSFGYALDIDLDYRLVQRFQSNQGSDRGREIHSLSFLSLLQPRDWFSFRFQTAHNLPRIRGEPLALLERRNYQPLVGEISLTPKKNLEFFFKEEYTLFDAAGAAHPLSTQSEIIWGQRADGGNYFSMGTSYFSSREGVLELRHSARISPSEKWHFEGTLRTLLFYRNANFLNVAKAEFTEKELLVRKEWRCWDFSFTFRERTGVLEFLVNLELRLERLNREKSIRTDQESEWYPWRGWK